MGLRWLWFLSHLWAKLLGEDSECSYVICGCPLIQASEALLAGIHTPGWLYPLPEEAKSQRGGCCLVESITNSEVQEAYCLPPGHYVSRKGGWKDLPLPACVVASCETGTG